MKYLVVLGCLGIAGALILFYYFPDVISKSATYNIPEIEVVKEKKATMLAFGDLMLDRQVRIFMNNEGSDYPFKNIEWMFPGNDIVFANLEGTITTNASKTVNLKNKILHFTFDPSVASMLSGYGFNVVSLANNHAYDFLRDGFLQTKKYLDEAGISYFGDPYNKEELSVIKEVNALKIAFIGYHEFYTSTTTPILEEIKRVKNEADVVIVAPHWGYEYERIHSDFQTKRAREFIDAGASMVIGAHPHVIQPIEIYKGKPIFYSLGNFVFDQNFSFDTTHALALQIIIDNSAAQIELIPIDIIQSQVSLSLQDTREKILNEVAKAAIVSEETKEEIRKGNFIVTLTD